MTERLARLGGRLHLGFVEVRAPVSPSARISLRHGFVPVGLLPQKLLFGEQREHAVLNVQYFGIALELRKNHPRIIPEAHHLAELALAGVGVEPDVIVDEAAAPYALDGPFELEELTQEGYSSLLRIERGRTRNRAVFGPQRLHYGMFRLTAAHSTYFVARSGGTIVGALGYMVDDVERQIRVFEVIYAREEAVPFLLEAVAERCEADGIMGVEIDVSAHAPRMQRTLLGLGYLPCAYVPAMAFHEVERVDVIKMYRLFDDLMDLPLDVPEPALSIGHYVLGQFAARQVLPRLARAAEGLDLCGELTEEQSMRLLGEFTTGVYEAGSTIFEEGDAAGEMMLILDGHVSVTKEGKAIGRVGPGECLGEVAFLNGTSHSLGAIADTDVEFGLLMRARLEAVVRRRPDIGIVVYRNLARGLGEKLRRADRVGAEERRESA